MTTQTQEVLREEWDGLDTPVERVEDEEGRNIANAMIRSRRVSDAPGEEDYLYVDDVDGFQVVSKAHAMRLIGS